MERLVFNTAKHKMEELKKYGFVKMTSQYVLDFIKYDAYDYSYLLVEIDDYKVLDFTYVDLADIQKAVNVAYDLIKDGLVVKEKKNESKN